jgi:hypothetical protein
MLVLASTVCANRVVSRSTISLETLASAEAEHMKRQMRVRHGCVAGGRLQTEPSQHSQLHNVLQCSGITKSGSSGAQQGAWKDTTR